MTPSLSKVDARTLTEYAAAVGSSAPTPGGGSVIANVAAFASGLAEMVANLTISKPTPHHDLTHIISARDAAASLREQFLSLALADENAYGAYRAAAKLPRATDQEKAERQSALEAALVGSAKVPLAIAGQCVDLLGILHTVAAEGTKHALADAYTSNRFTLAALLSALDMVSANTTLMKNRQQASLIDAEAASLRVSGSDAHDRVSQLLAERENA